MSFKNWMEQFGANPAAPVKLSPGLDKEIEKVAGAEIKNATATGQLTALKGLPDKIYAYFAKKAADGKFKATDLTALAPLQDPNAMNKPQQPQATGIAPIPPQGTQ